MPPTAVMPLMALVADISGEWSAGGTPSTAWQSGWSARQGRVEYALGRVGLAGRKQGPGGAELACLVAREAGEREDRHHRGELTIGRAAEHDEEQREHRHPHRRREVRRPSRRLLCGEEDTRHEERECGESVA